MIRNYPAPQNMKNKQDNVMIDKDVLTDQLNVMTELWQTAEYYIKSNKPEYAYGIFAMMRMVAFERPEKAVSKERKAAKLAGFDPNSVDSSIQLLMVEFKKNGSFLISEAQQ